MAQLDPVTLEGRWVRLEPLGPHHESGLVAAADDPEIWRYLTAPLRTPAAMHAFVEAALANAARGVELPFATIDRGSGAVIGSTRFLDIRLDHRAVEIGHTWLSRAWWRTRCNTEAKYLQLRYLFDDLHMARVSLKTDRLNERSQRAIARLGAVREGILRKHMIVQDGRSRDTVYFSILDDEWPGVRATLEESLYREG